MINFRNSNMLKMLIQPAAPKIDATAGVAPRTPVVIGEQEATDETKATKDVGGDNVDVKVAEEEYNKALEEATQKAINHIKEDYATVSNPREATSVKVIFGANGKSYTVTVKPTYYKQEDGTYSIYDRSEKNKKCETEPKFDITTKELSDIEAEQFGHCQVDYGIKADVNVAYTIDEPSDWIDSFGNMRFHEDDDGNMVKEGNQKFLYKAELLKKHIPEDMLNRFFVQDEDFSGGYRLADNVKSIDLIGNDENGDARYEVVYINDDGEEIGQQFTVSKDRQGNLYAHTKRRINKTEEKAKAEEELKIKNEKKEVMVGILKKMGSLASLDAYKK